MIDAIPIPKKGDDVRVLYQIVALCAKAINALLKMSIVQGARNHLEITSFNSTLEYIGGGGAAAKPIILPWTPVAVPYLGGGSPPVDWGLNFQIRPGAVLDGFQARQAGNASAIIQMPPNCIDGFFVWLELTFDADGRLLSFVYDHGTDLPTQTTVAGGAAGAPPPKAFYPILTMYSTATQADLVNAIRGATGGIQVMPVVTGTNERRMQFYPVSAILANGFLQ